MKTKILVFLVTVGVFSISTNLVLASNSLDQQKIAMKQLEVARSELSVALMSLQQLPDEVKKTISRHLENAEFNISNAQRVFTAVPFGIKHFCVVDSIADGPFGGEGATNLEASYNALKSCREKARSGPNTCRDNINPKCDKSEF